jgi:transcriptional regulator with XRE-family HTH domain
MRTVTDPRAQRAHHIDIHVGTRVRTRRKALKISQQELAGHLSLTFQQVQKYERGSNRISASKLFEIAQVLQVPVAYFFEGYHQEGLATTQDSPQAEVHEFLRSAEAMDLGTAFLGIQSSEQRRRVLDLMRAMAAEA